MAADSEQVEKISDVALDAREVAVAVVAPADAEFPDPSQNPDAPSPTPYGQASATD